MRAFVVIVTLTAGACVETTPRWDLTHDRVIAVRASPPAIEAGGSAQLDALVSAEGVARVIVPVEVTLSPDALATVVQQDGAWVVIAGTSEMLAAAQARLPTGTSLRVDAELVFDVAGIAKHATKSVRLSATGENPVVSIRLADGQVATSIETSVGVETQLSTDAPDGASVDWLTSLGELTDDDDPVAFLTAEEAGAGSVVCVRRELGGGVGWAIAALAVE
ncbi:MAG: hypothetical protein SFX73_13340 [Kofleriaceae bacterium]|nr:hypothetical protein [Kofleriaceae bacterium]